MNISSYTDVESFSIIVLTSALAGAAVLIYFWFGRNKTTNTDQSNEGATANGTKLPKKKTKIHFKPAKKPPAVFNHPYLHTTLKGHSGAVLQLGVSVNGKYLVSCSEDRSIRIWSVKEFGSGNKSAICNIEFDHAQRICFSPDSRALLAGLNRNNTVRVLKLGKKEDGTSTTFTPLEKDFPTDTKQTLLNLGIGMSASGGSFVMTAYDDTTIKIRDIKGDVLHSINTNQGNNLHAAVSPCGSLKVVIAKRLVANFVPNLPTPSSEEKLQVTKSSASLHPDKEFVACAGWTPDVKVWSIVFDRGGSYQTVTRAFELKGHNSSVWSLDFSNDSHRMITICKDGYWRFYDTQVEYEKGQEPYLINSGRIVVGSESPTESACRIALSADAQVAAVSCLTSIAVFSTKTGKKELEIDGVHTAEIVSICFDIAGRYIVTAGDRHIRVFYNTLGYKETIRELEEKIKKPNVTSATQERLKKQINDARKSLAEIEKRKKEQTKTKS